ncbi:UDP-N-acetylglucosamine 2-epimerase (non-hydrolyzing) [Thermococci archaeon]|nr:MAG: UDP-N-acetylglucosamine 2-epimerase (non-hydrolyzing) [Thermococci archaeon]
MISVVLGTRPEIVKMAPIIKELKKRDIDYFVIHTGQHYSYNLDKVFFENFDLEKPRYNLEVGSGTHGKQTGEILKRIERVLIDEKPEIVLVEGDTNTVLASALAASKLHIKVGHVEAGLRSFWKWMPEEINRVLTDHISDLLFAPTEIARNNLLNEGIREGVYVVGNTIVDSLKLKKIEKIEKDFILLTLHREENADNPEKLKSIIKGTEMISEYFDTPVIYPIHPRTKKNLKKFGIEINEKFIKLVDPLNYFKFLSYLKSCKFVLTDSGGVQEEACILKIPCITLRDNTERPETINIGANILAGNNPKKILESAVKMSKANKKWENPYGEDVGKKIVDIVQASR